jgi:hypothetical protein
MQGAIRSQEKEIAALAGSGPSATTSHDIQSRERTMIKVTHYDSRDAACAFAAPSQPQPRRPS